MVPTSNVPTKETTTVMDDVICCGICVGNFWRRDSATAYEPCKHASSATSHPSEAAALCSQACSHGRLSAQSCSTMLYSTDLFRVRFRQTVTAKNALYKRQCLAYTLRLWSSCRPRYQTPAVLRFRSSFTRVRVSHHASGVYACEELCAVWNSRARGLTRRLVTG